MKSVICFIAAILSTGIIWGTPAVPERTSRSAGGRLPAAPRPSGIRGEPRQVAFRAGDLSGGLEVAADGIHLRSLRDTAAGRELLAQPTLPLFSLLLRRAGGKDEARLDAGAGWGRVEVRERETELELSWEQPRDAQLAGLRVSARAALDPGASAVHWRLQVENSNPRWSVWRVHFPQLAVADLGDGARVFFPRGPGEVQPDVWRRAFTYRGLYPNGWTTMQFMAAYQTTGDRQTGLYVACHDPEGSTKELAAESRPEGHSLTLAFEHPAPGMGAAGNSVTLGGEAVWQLLRGDWFDAARIYRDWARREARWMPKTLGADGRTDTPAWMRELPLWAQGGGTPAECVPAMEEFARFMGVPVGFHWYSWHQIPFDNDYPHYFPAKAGFAEGVRRLKQAGVHVMPYINGRLWDTRDRGAEDFEFTRLALPATTRDEDGKPYTETYSSKEMDGSPVRLAVMCPTTPLWQERVRSTVLRLFNEAGVDGVYIDQIAAAPPKLCFDTRHGHPAGGGHWWVDGYDRMVASIRAARPSDRMLTTECNAEPFLDQFDGYLTWHWQYDGQVPAFPAVYGGAVQLFGRAYRGGPTKDLALRMKAGQQLVFGEQLGWLGSEVVHEAENAAFLRQLARLRWQFRQYFAAGEMARPPQLEGTIPTVHADWQWSGEWPVTTDALLAGAWQLPRRERILFLFVNVSDAPVTASVVIDSRRYPVAGTRPSITSWSEAGKGAGFTAGSTFRRPISVPARSALAWELVRDDTVSPP